LEFLPMSFSFLTTGFLIGLLVAAPIGPIGVLCIRRTFAYGFSSGTASGFGAAVADALYGAIAAFGLTFISSFLLGHQTFLKFVGGFLLLYFGVKTFIAKPVKTIDGEAHVNLHRDAISTFILTATSPMTILIFLGIFASFGLTYPENNLILPALTVAGVFAGSCFWWLALCSIVGLFKAKFNDTLLIWVNRISGAAIFVCGIVLLLEHNLKLMARLTGFIHNF
jgi:threonine/homoserine/homoserine lactone efflux protein